MDYLFGKLTELAKKVDTFALCNLKKYLSLISVEKEEHCFDPILAAYLLNPLKNDYDFEDIAREQLNLIIDEKADEKIKDLIIQ